MSKELQVKRPSVSQLSPPPRLLMGPGPCNAHPRVYQAMALPQVGHMDSVFLDYVEEVKDLLRYVWQTKNRFTVPVSGTGSAAWEACVANLVQAGDTVLTLCNGYFGERSCDISSRYGAVIERLDKPWGEVFTLAEIEEGLKKYRPQLLHVTHAETSTGACQPIEGIGELCHKYDCLFLLDTVTSIGGLPVFLDEWKVDACYAGGQKCLSCPPGIAPLTFSERAFNKLIARKTKTPNWYLDMSMIAAYLVPSADSAPRVYHHTAPISMMYALRESLRIVAEEGLESCWERHSSVAKELWKGLEAMGLTLHVEEKYRLPSLTTVRIPEGVDGGAVCKYLLQKYNLEVGGGLGQLKGKVWRIGLMGYNARLENVVFVLAALRDALAVHGYKLP